MNSSRRAKILSFSSTIAGLPHNRNESHKSHEIKQLNQSAGPFRQKFVPSEMASYNNAANGKTVWNPTHVE